MLKEDYKTYLHRIRRIEFHRVFSKVPKKAFENVLEIGAGDTFQSQFLSTRAKKLTSTEVNPGRFKPRKLANVKFVLCNAEKLPFGKGRFDLIYSSNVFEHIQNRKKALREMERVLAKNGIMIHVMPNRTWKTLNTLLHYPNIAIATLELGKRTLAKKDSSLHKAQIKENIWLKRFKLLLPQVHGTAKSNFQEFLEFGKSQWIKFFEKNNFTVHNTIRLPLCSGYGFGFNRLRRLGEQIGFGSSYAYVVTRKDEHLKNLIFFET